MISPQSLMYDMQKELFWFPVPEQKDGKVGLNIAYLGDKTYTDVVTYTGSREDYVFGYVIPTHLLRDVRLSGNKPSQQIRQLMFELIPNYDRLENEIEQYGITHSSIQAFEEKRGDCIQRTSIGAAIARVNDVPYRIVASQNLAPDINSVKDYIFSRLGPFMVGRILSSPMHVLFPPLEMYRSPYPHKWLEVYEDERWVTVDTIEWDPTTFLPFRQKARERFVCKEITLEGLISEPSPK